LGPQKSKKAFWPFFLALILIFAKIKMEGKFLSVRNDSSQKTD